MLKKMSPQKCNYEIYNKELLIIIKAFKEWYSKLINILIKDLIKMVIDYKNLEYFITIK